MDLLRTEKVSVGRHLVHPTVADLVDDVFDTATVKPSVVREIGRAHGRISLSLGSVADGTELGELRLGGLGLRLVVGTPAQAQNVLGEILDARVCLLYTSPSPRD